MYMKKRKSAAGGRPNSEPGQIPLVHPAGQLFSTTTLLVTKGKLKRSYSDGIVAAFSIHPFRVAKEF